MTILKASETVLRESGKPLKSDEITRLLLQRGLWSTKGKTPSATVSAALYTDIKRRGKNSVFVKVAPGIFSLREFSKQSLNSVENEADGHNTDRSQVDAHQVLPSDHEKGLSFLQAAYEVLDKYGSKTPVHYRDITAKALQLGLLNSSGKTPEATMNAQLITDIKRAKAIGEPGRFVRASRGMYGLSKWIQIGLPGQIKKHNKVVQKKLLDRLKALEPAVFEELIGQLLAEMGFESIEVTKYGNDGGIDVRGSLLIDDVIRIKMAVQVKRWKSNIQSPVVQQVRGSLGAHEQGLIITTSDFSKGAIIEAVKPDKTPVGLMNGEQLVGLLMEYNLGVRRNSYHLFEMDDEL